MKSEKLRTHEPPLFLFGVLLAGIWFYLLVLSVESTTLISIANLLGPTAVGVAVAFAGIRVVYRRQELIWTPYAWFLLTIILFYSAGPLIYPLGSSVAIADVSALLPVTGKQLLRTNLLNAVGILSILVGFRLVWGLGYRKRSGKLRGSSEHGSNAKTIAFVFLIAGGLLEYFLILPSAFGFYKFALPGVLENLGNLYLLGLMVLAYVVARGDRAWRMLLIVLWAVQFMVSVLLFSKAALMFAISLPAMGAYLGHRRFARMVGWGLVIVMVYLLSSPLVDYGRTQISMQTGNINNASLEQRTDYTWDWLSHLMSKSSNPQLEDGALAGWTRLDYAPEQAFVMSRYDEGFRGHTLKNLAIVLIPRILWPGKPIINRGAKFYYLMSGHRGSSLGLGLFGEGYWDGGWVELISLALITGAIFGWLSILIVGWIQRRSFEYLPSIFVGISLSFGGGSFVSSVIGGTGIFFSYVFVVWLVLLLTRHSKNNFRFSETTMGGTF